MEDLSPSQDLVENKKDPTYLFSKKNIFFAIGVVLFLILWYFLFLSAPTDFPVDGIITIDEGISLRGTSLKLQQEHIIRSRLAFEAFMIVYGGEKHVVPTDYLLDGKLPVYELARRIARGESHLAPVKVVIPEGFSNSQIADAYS